ncbi:MAG: hypothetical protein WCS01_04895 [bacterium]
MVTIRAMAITPVSFFSFAADHVELLKDIFYRTREQHGVAEAELLGLIRRHAKPGATSAFHILERMQELGFVETVPDATAQYTLTAVFAALLAQVLQEYRTTSVEVIQGYLSAFEALSRELEESAAAGPSGGSRAVRALMDLEQNIERLRQDSRSNRDAILIEVLRTKANREHETALKRYERINWLWTRYMIPLRDMIDTRKAMDGALDRLDRAIQEASLCHVNDGAVARALAGIDARLMRLRRSVTEDYRESLAELAPLYEALRRDSAVARGASLALDRLGRLGVARLRLEERLALCGWQLQGLFDDDALRQCLQDIRGYTPSVAAPLARAVPSGRREDVLAGVAFDAAAAAAVPIPDAFEWLIGLLGDESPLGILRGYGRLRSGRFGRVAFSGNARDYRLRTLRIRACPMRVERSV